MYFFCLFALKQQKIFKNHTFFVVFLQDSVSAADDSQSSDWSGSRTRRQKSRRQRKKVKFLHKEKVKVHNSAVFLLLRSLPVAVAALSVPPSAPQGDQDQGDQDQGGPSQKEE